MKLQPHGGLQLMQIIFFMEKSCTRVSRQKGAQNDFFNCITNRFIEIFLIFCIKRNGLKLS